MTTWIGRSENGRLALSVRRFALGRAPNFGVLSRQCPRRYAPPPILMGRARLCGILRTAPFRVQALAIPRLQGMPPALPAAPNFGGKSASA